MLENVYEGLNDRSKVYLSTVYFCKMNPTCVSSKLCEFILDAIASPSTYPCQCQCVPLWIIELPVALWERSGWKQIGEKQSNEGYTNRLGWENIAKLGPQVIVFDCLPWPD